MTIDHIAARSGFSKATVSRVINHEGSVKPSTGGKNRTGHQELGYTRNTIASALSGQVPHHRRLLPDIITEYYRRFSWASTRWPKKKTTTSSSNKKQSQGVDGSRTKQPCRCFYHPEQRSAADRPRLSRHPQAQGHSLPLHRKPMEEHCPAILIDNVGGPGRWPTTTRSTVSAGYSSLRVPRKTSIPMTGSMDSGSA